MTDAEVAYAREQDLSVAEFSQVLAESGLGATRPLDDAVRIGRMLAHANLIMTARRRRDRRLLGVARCVTDFSWCAYVSELAVGAEAQGLGVGRGLLAAVQAELGPEVSVILLSMPDAVGFYERIGMEPQKDAFAFRRTR
ncbi:GNAT family N-acetyltransferase [Phenylobacterium montanum]|uniref:GNAT family N-acetyltransferase n=1 Tax=Phenylobacterium montanum TaxID=2823693 RepID=A0A975G176_9CAUL|nr:GNAT family N-acetyltransferase [Caulobacter sp. S6]QUD88673.1 GNAT family N-acetyltransferase [Caulobacter sp. S6]